MPASSTNNDRSAHAKAPDRAPPEGFDELATGPDLQDRIVRSSQGSGVPEPHQPNFRFAALPRDNTGQLPDGGALQEALLDEATDIEIHPDELAQDQRFYDDPLRICEEIRKALHQSPYKELHRLNIRMAEDRIAILGQTTSFFLKQMAQEVTRQVAPTLAVDNLIGVRHIPSHHLAH